jgi:hypothetical protein
MKVKRNNGRCLIALVVVPALSLILVLGLFGGMIRPDSVQAKITEGMADTLTNAHPFNESHPGLQNAMAAQERHTPRLMALPEVVGTAIGITEAGEPAVLVFLKGAASPGRIPGHLDGIPVVATVTGEFKSLKPPPGKGPDGGATKTTDSFPRPVPIGISTGNEGECSAGTIGARVKNGSTVYALSNNHVYALENKAALDSKVLQPGRYDSQCTYDQNSVFGNLFEFVEIKFNGDWNTVDGAIAVTNSEYLDNVTPDDGYGIPKSATKPAALDMTVQKYGRTTKLTKGTIVGINATVNVGYSSGTAVFVNQIVVYSNKPVIKAGDSGSLLVTDPGREPVGLLFAGNLNGKYAIANPIGAVLSSFGVSIDGE